MENEPMSPDPFARKYTLDDLYNYIVSQITPEVALKRLLASSLIKYDNLKFPKDEEGVHPTIIIAMAALDMGWAIAVDTEEVNLQGLVVGTTEFIDNHIKNDKD